MNRLEVWGLTASGQAVHRIVLARGALRAEIITLGAALRDLRYAGQTKPLVLGLNSVADYESHGMYFGAIVGRFANRIADAHIQIKNHPFTLTPNDNCNILHGGPGGFSNKLWAVTALEENSVTLSLDSPDGDMGFPGALTAQCTYMLNEDSALSILLTAQTDAPTICAMAHHSYFNLHDGGASPIDAHDLFIDAPKYLPVNGENVPIGEPKGVANTDFDFQSPRPIAANTIDHNFCLSDRRLPLRNVAALSSQISGVRLDVATSEPGLQVYTADALTAGLSGLDDISYRPRSGVALETQVWPDAPNRPDFPSAMLYPGEELRQETVYQFRKVSAEL